MPWQNAANAARELVIQRLLFVGNACENEEQRLLEKVHAEEERAHQSILTQRVHWAEALQKLGALRTYLVDMITNLDDQALVVSATPCANRQVSQPRSDLDFSSWILRDLNMVFSSLLH